MGRILACASRETLGDERMPPRMAIAAWRWMEASLLCTPAEHLIGSGGSCSAWEWVDASSGVAVTEAPFGGISHMLAVYRILGTAAT
jgi:hypothetical protein